MPCKTWKRWGECTFFGSYRTTALGIYSVLGLIAQRIVVVSAPIGMLEMSSVQKTKL